MIRRPRECASCGELEKPEHGFICRAGFICADCLTEGVHLLMDRKVAEAARDLDREAA